MTNSIVMTTRALPHLLFSALLVLAAVALSLTAGTGALLGLGMLAVAISITLVGLVRFGAQFVLIALLVVGYFSGWIKIHTGSWIGYALPDGLCLLLLASAFIGRSRSALPLPRNQRALAHRVLSAGVHQPRVADDPQSGWFPKLDCVHLARLRRL
jgi:hypothetical protein